MDDLRLTRAPVVMTGEMRGFPVHVEVKAVEPERRITIEWPGEGGPNEVELPPRGRGIHLRAHHGPRLRGDGDSLMAQATDSTQGLSLVRAGAKAFLEHGTRLELVRDPFPAGVGE